MGQDYTDLLWRPFVPAAYGMLGLCTSTKNRDDWIIMTAEAYIDYAQYEKQAAVFLDFVTGLAEHLRSQVGSFPPADVSLGWQGPRLGCQSQPPAATRC